MDTGKSPEPLHPVQQQEPFAISTPISHQRKTTSSFIFLLLPRLSIGRQIALGMLGAKSLKRSRVINLSISLTKIHNATESGRRHPHWWHSANTTMIPVRHNQLQFNFNIIMISWWENQLLPIGRQYLSCLNQLCSDASCRRGGDQCEIL